MPTLPEMEAFLHQIPIVGGDYYIVLCVMSAITFLVVAVVRSDVESPVGALGATIALLSGLIIAAGGVAVPVIGMARFWTQVHLQTSQAPFSPHQIKHAHLRWSEDNAGQPLPLPIHPKQRRGLDTLVYPFLFWSLYVSLTANAA
jgi:hypothetical protein